MNPPVDLNRSRIFAEQLLDWVRGKGPILILAHDNPDPDSLAAAFALQHLFLVKAGRESVIAFGGVIGRGENRAMVAELEIDAVPLEKVDLDRFDVVCMVDTQPGAGNNSFPADREVHVVIDHHPLRKEAGTWRWVDVRENYGASATILYEYLVSQEVYLGTKLATILYYAIKSETQELGREWCRADRQAYLHLFPLVNNRILFKITHPTSPRQYFVSFSKAIQNARIYGRVLVFNLLDIENPDMVAEMADFLLRMEGIEVVLGMGRYRQGGILSLRTLDHSINAGLAMQQVLSGLGTAGGHGLIAGGQVRTLEGGEDALRDLEQTLTGRLLKTLQIEGIQGEPLTGS